MHIELFDREFRARFRMPWGGAGATIMHKPTGLFLYGGWGKQKVDTDGTAAATLVQPRQYDVVSPAGYRVQMVLARQDQLSSASTAATTQAPILAERGINRLTYSGRLASFRISRPPMRLFISFTSTPMVNVLVTGSTSRTKLDAFQEVIVGTKINF